MRCQSFIKKINEMSVCSRCYGSLKINGTQISEVSKMLMNQKIPTQEQRLTYGTEIDPDTLYQGFPSKRQRMNSA